MWNIKETQTEKGLYSSSEERSATEHYFERGFYYDAIAQLLEKYHDISMNLRTIERREDCMSMGWEKEMKSIQSMKFRRYKLNVKLKALHHFLDIILINFKSYNWNFCLFTAEPNVNIHYLVSNVNCSDQRWPLYKENIAWQKFKNMTVHKGLCWTCMKNLTIVQYGTS